GEGVPYIQLDNPHYTDYISDEMLEQMRLAGIDPEQAMQEDIEADNAAIDGFDRDRVTIAMHLCRGNGQLGACHLAGGDERMARAGGGGGVRVTVPMHLCGGNGQVGAWHVAGGYERIAERVLGGVNVDRWLLEYD